MMGRFYNLGGICYNISVTGHCTDFLFAEPSFYSYYIKARLCQESVNCSVTRSIAGQAQAGLDILKAKTDTFMVGRLRAGFAKGISMLFLQEALYSNVLRFVNTRIPNISQTIPTQESPGNSFASDSLSFLTRLITPGLSPLFPQLAASIVGSLLSEAASPISERS